MQTKSPILACWPLTYLVGVIHRNKEDKQKKKTRATVAKAKGLEPLAEIIKEQKETKYIYEIAKEYVNIENLSEER